MSRDTIPIRVIVARPRLDRGVETESAVEQPRMAGTGASADTPLIDIYEVPEGLMLEADLPGATEESLSIQLEDNVLNLRARIAPSVADGSQLLHEEYRIADFDRSFILSDEVDRSRITAEFKNGVLRLKLPKADRSRTRRIEIKAS